MKIFFIDPNNMTPQYTYPYVENLQKNINIEIRFFSTNYSKFTDYYDKSYNIYVTYIFSSKIASIKSLSLRKLVKFFSLPIHYLQLLQIILKEKPDIVHFNWLAVPILDNIFIKIIKNLKIKVVINVHNLIQHEKSKLRPLELKIFLNADKIVSLSRFTQKILLDNFGLESVHIPHGNCYKKELKLFDKKNTLSHNEDFNLIFVGGIRPYKGIELLLQAISRLDYEINLKILGKASLVYEKYLRLIIKNLRILNKINFQNKFVYYEELIEKINKCDLGILPYQEATQSGVIYFFNSLKKPLVITDVGGLKEQINPKTCEIVKPDTISIKNGIQKAYDKIFQNKYQLKDFDEINNEQNFSNTIQKFYELYRSIT
ncbi:MAG: glycosyltransferase family 4 protein [Candidatus Cloacimonetes bacterium]|nr:glycosyltransferase family 4 protein [Candidatus Cloacimonadota bacterium]